MKPFVSIVIVSFNTLKLLQPCLQACLDNLRGISAEIIVVDNGSSDGSVEYIRSTYPQVIVVANPKNLGFAAANNIGFKMAKGKYIVILNTDAFLHAGVIPSAIQKMEENDRLGLCGVKLVGRNGEWQPSARLFPSLLNHFLQLTGLASTFPRSRFFGRGDRTWSSAYESTETDWVPGAFAIIRRSVLEEIGFFDERFFFYYEEVDLCRRVKKAGYAVWYFSGATVTHLGGASSPSQKLKLWELRSRFLYFRKHHGAFGVHAIKLLTSLWNTLRIWKNKIRNGTTGRQKVQESQLTLQLVDQAWKETDAGRTSPPTPW
jgi:GT2 family glycosyltransferase